MDYYNFTLVIGPIAIAENNGVPWECGRRAGLVGSWSLKQSFLLVDCHDFTLVIGPIVIAENNVESHGSVGEGREGGAVGQLFPETQLPIGELP